MNKSSIFLSIIILKTSKILSEALFIIIIFSLSKSDLENIKQEEKQERENLLKEVEAKEAENLAEGNLEVDDPIEIEKDEKNQSESLEKENQKVRLEL